MYRPPDPPPRAAIDRQVRRVGILIILGCLLACCQVFPLWEIIPPLRFAAIDHIPQVQGRLDRIAGAAINPRGSLSPDGRILFLHFNRFGQRRYVLWDLVTDTRQPVALTEPQRFSWLDGDWLAVYGYFGNDINYVLVNAHTGEVTPLVHYPLTQYHYPDGHHTIEPLLRDAPAVYVLDRLDGYSSYKVITVGTAEPYLFDLGYGEYFDLERTALEDWLKTIPHRDLTRHGLGGPRVVRQGVFSHDGQFYAINESRGVGSRLAIYRTKDEQLLASVAKPGWGPAIIGWDYQNEGVYFGLSIGGSAGAMAYPETPFFKLTPLTPAEARWQAVRQVATPVAIAVGIAGAGWWWRRRRTARR